MTDLLFSGRPKIAAVASPARVCNWLLGGKDNFQSDREVARQLLAAVPQAHTLAATNRHFVLRAVRHASLQGVRQFVDLGCGLPTLLDTHAIAWSAAPGARVVYVDHDPLVTLHGQATRAKLPGIAAIDGDIRYPDKVLADPQLDLIDFSEPVLVLLAAVLHFIAPAEDVAAIVAAFTNCMAPGSHLAISHAITDGSDPDVLAAIAKAYRHADTPFTARPAADIAAMFDGFELFAPGLADIAGQSLRQSSDPHGVQVLGMTGRKAGGFCAGKSNRPDTDGNAWDTTTRR